MLNIVFVKQGTAYSSEYVSILADMIRRNLPENFPGQFVCFTDNPVGLDVSIVARELPCDLKGWWGKLWLFKNGHFADGDRVLYFDLDTVIVGALDLVVKYDGPFAILRDFYRDDGLQSAVMAWPANTMDHVWAVWNKFGRPESMGGDQAWLEEIFEADAFKPDVWQELYPKAFVSFKKDCGRLPPRGAKVVVFHGEPRPHNCGSDWVADLWKINGGQGFDLEQICNTGDEKIFANIHSAIALDYPWLDKVPAHNGEAVIVGGGPSLAEKLNEIRWRKDCGNVIFATNYTAKFLRLNGIAADYQVILDARHENAGFLDVDVKYLLASQVSPNTILAAGIKGLAATLDPDITIFHPIIPGIEDLVWNDKRPVHLVGGGSTVGLKTIAIAHCMGFRTFHLFGMDSSYCDDKHHAYPQVLNDGDRVLDVMANERTFKAAPWMVTQVNEFQELAATLANEGCIITVAGDGLLPYVAHQMMKDIPLSAADLRAKAILERLPEGPVIGAEIGVFAGDLSSRLLSREGLTLYMVDSWAADGKDYAPNSDDFHANLNRSQQDTCLARTQAVTAFAGERATILIMPSDRAAKEVPDHSLDFVFIDADHSYEGCKRDIEAWYPKLKDGALLSGHDYENPDFPSWGVKRAVHEFADAHGFEVDLGDNLTWFIRKLSALEIAA